MSVSITDIVPATRAAGAARSRPRISPVSAVVPRLPAIAAGQLWLVELASGEALPAPVHHALDGANVVIYDRALTAAVADGLPLGSYAEPASGSEAAAARSVRFARDGWSVARLLPAGLSPRERTRRVQDVVDELAAAKVAGRLSVTILADAADGIEERIEARFDDLTAIVASFPRNTRLAIVIDAFGEAVATRLHAVAANGLAG
jgi:hypothetical protein